MGTHRRGATAYSGVLLVDKPAGMTSHDVVARIRRLTGEGRVGHAGTLDPLASGLLVVVLGSATSLASQLSAHAKRYRATIAFGVQTTTDDAEGSVLASSTVPQHLFEPHVAEDILARFLGSQLQQPPDFSARKYKGERAYKIARKGGVPELEPRPIEVFEARLISADATAHTWSVEFHVSKGTYIRALARDIGRAAGTYAHLSILRRMASGSLNLDDAWTLEELEAHCSAAPDDRYALADCLLERTVLERSLDDSRRAATVGARRIEPAVVTLGVFDGVHRGHQALLAEAAQYAHAHSLPLVAFTFDPLPERVIRPQAAPALLADVDERLRLLTHFGADRAEILAFTPQLSQSSPAWFIDDVLASCVKARAIFVGCNFHFGQRGEGTAQTLREHLAQKGIPVFEEALLKYEAGTTISSTHIRSLLAQGDLAGRLRSGLPADPLRSVGKQGFGVLCVRL